MQEGYKKKKKDELRFGEKNKDANKQTKNLL